MGKIKICGYAVLSGLLLWLTFNYHFLWPFCFVAITPLLHLVYEKKLKWGQQLLLGCTAGWIMGAGIMIWHWQVLPVDWAGIDNQWHGIILMLYVWGLSSAMGGFVGLWSVSFCWLKRNNFYDIFLASALWIVFEYVRSMAISILWYGDGGLIGPHWSIGFIGYTLASSKLFLPIASIGGAYLLGAFAIAINVLAYLSFSAWHNRLGLKSHLKIFGAVLGIVLAIALPSYFSDNTKHESIKIAVVSTYVPSYSGLSNKEFVNSIKGKVRILESIKNSGQDVDVIAFPEDSRILVGLQILGQQKITREIFGESDILIVDSARVASGTTSAPELKYFYLETKSGRLTHSDKLFLVPHGEYLPIISDVLLRLSGLQNWVDKFRTARVSSKGHNIVPAEFRNFKIGAVACSEIMSSDINGRLITEGANFIINGASHSVFHGSKILYDQMVNMAKLRAVESNRYYVVAGNFIPSFVINNKGKMIAETQWGVPGVLYEDIEVIDENSIYIRYGHQLTALLFAAIIGAALIKRCFPQVLNHGDPETDPKTPARNGG